MADVPPCLRLTTRSTWRGKPASFFVDEAVLATMSRTACYAKSDPVADVTGHVRGLGEL